MLFSKYGNFDRTTPLIKRLTKTFTNAQQSKIKEKLTSIELELLNSHKKDTELNELLLKLNQTQNIFIPTLSAFRKQNRKLDH